MAGVRARCRVEIDAVMTVNASTATRQTTSHARQPPVASTTRGAKSTAARMHSRLTMCCRPNAVPWASGWISSTCSEKLACQVPKVAATEPPSATNSTTTTQTGRSAPDDVTAIRTARHAQAATPPESRYGLRAWVVSDLRAHTRLPSRAAAQKDIVTTDASRTPTSSWSTSIFCA